MTEGQGASWEDEEAWPSDGEVRVWTWLPTPLYRKWSTGPDEHGVMLGYEPTNPVWVEDRRSPSGASESGCGCGRGAAKAPEVAPDYGAEENPKQHSDGADDSSSTEEKVRPVGLGGTGTPERKYRPEGLPATGPLPLEGGNNTSLYPEDFSVDMTPPPASSWGSDCLAEWAPAIASWCGVPVGISRSVDDFENMQPDRSIVVTGATAEEERLVRMAWALLVANLDLVQFADCWAQGGISGGCVAGRVAANLMYPAPVHVDVYDAAEGAFLVAPSSECRSPFYGIAPPVGGFGGLIQVCRGTPWTDSYLGAWRKDDRYERLCAALDLAATLLHETTHLCGLAIPDAGERCRVSYLTENTFRWAIYKRYGDAQRTSCCGKFYDGDPDERLNPAMGGRESAVQDFYFMRDSAVYLWCPS